MCSFGPLSLEIDKEEMISAFDNYFLQAQRVRQMVRNDFDRVFRVQNVLRSSQDSVSKDDSHSSLGGCVDVLIHPSAIQTAPLLNEVLDRSPERDTLKDYVQDVLTVPASLAGVPALSVPMKPMPELGVEGSSWPIGISIVGQWGTDELVLKVGQVVERLSKS